MQWLSVQTGVWILKKGDIKRYLPDKSLSSGESLHILKLINYSCSQKPINDDYLGQVGESWYLNEKPEETTPGFLFEMKPAWQAQKGKGEGEGEWEGEGRGSGRARGRERGRRRGGEKEREMNIRGFFQQASSTLSPQSPSLFPFLPIPYPFRRLLLRLSEMKHVFRTP